MVVQFRGGALLARVAACGLLMLPCACHHETEGCHLLGGYDLAIDGLPVAVFDVDVELDDVHAAFTCSHPEYPDQESDWCTATISEYYLIMVRDKLDRSVLHIDSNNEPGFEVPDELRIRIATSDQSWVIAGEPTRKDLGDGDEPCERGFDEVDVRELPAGP